MTYLHVIAGTTALLVMLLEGWRTGQLLLNPDTEQGPVAVAARALRLLVFAAIAGNFLALAVQGAPFLTRQLLLLIPLAGYALSLVPLVWRNSDLT